MPEIVVFQIKVRTIIKITVIAFLTYDAMTGISRELHPYVQSLNDAISIRKIKREREGNDRQAS